MSVRDFVLWFACTAAAVVLMLFAFNEWVLTESDDVHRIPGQDEQFRGLFCVGNDAYLDLSINPDDVPAIKPDYKGCINGTLDQYEPESTS